MKIDGFVTVEDLIASRDASYLQLDEGIEYWRPQPRFLDIRANSKTDNQKLAEAFANDYCPPLPIRALFLSNAMVFGQGTVVTASAELIKNSAAEFINHGNSPDGFVLKGDALVTDNEISEPAIKGISLLVKRPWFRNYGHFLVDLLPIVVIAAREKLPIDTLIFGDVQHGQLRRMMDQTALYLFPQARKVFVADNRPLRFEKLVYVEPVHVPPLYKNPAAINSMIEKSREIFQSPPAELPSKIYVSRQKASGRKISNDDNLSEILLSRGFETMYPEMLDFEKQIACFSAAEVIVGAKGAALTTAAFSKTGANILILSPAGFIDPFFWDLLSPKGLIYSEIFCKAGDGPSISMRDITVDIAIVERWLDEFAM